MIRSSAIGTQGSCEIRSREGGDVAVDTQLGHGMVKLAHGFAHNREHGRMGVDEFVVVIPAAKHHEEGLALGSQGLAGTDGARDHLETARELARRERGLHGYVADRIGEVLGRVDRSAVERCEGLLEQVLVVQVHQAFDGRGSQGSQGVAFVVFVENHAAIALRGDVVTHGSTPRLEGVGARERDVHRDFLVGRLRSQDIRHAARPTIWRALVRNASLPVHDLVAVRKEPNGQSRTVVLEPAQGGGFD